MNCTCRVCERHRSIVAHLANIPETERPFFEDLVSELEHAEMDRDHLQAILDGSWPNAEEVLAGYRLRRQESAPAVSEEEIRDA